MMLQRIDVVNELYVPLLNAMGIYDDGNNGLIRRTEAGEKTCEMGGRRLVLPTEENLRNDDPNTKVFFHPLSENIARGDSPVFNYMKLAISIRVNFSITTLASMLLSIAGDESLEGKLKSNQLELVRLLPKVNDKMITNLAGSYSRLNLDKHTFYTVYNKRNGKIGQTSYNRVAVVRFPLIEQLNNVDKSEYWSAAKLRKADIAAYQVLFNYILPNWNVENHYSGYSDSLEAPSFHALASGFVTIMSRINELCNTFGEFGDTSFIACPDLHILEQALNELHRFSGVIHPLDGNIGDIAENRQSVNQLNTQPMGVAPSNLQNAVTQKEASIGATLNNAPAQTTQTNTPQPTVNAPGTSVLDPEVAKANPLTAMNGGFIGMGSPNPWMGMGGGFNTFDPQAAMVKAVEDQKKALASNPILNWNISTNPAMAMAMAANTINPVMQQQMQQQQMAQQMQQQMMAQQMAQQAAAQQQMQQQQVLAAMGGGMPNMLGGGMGNPWMGGPKFKTI